MGSEDTLSKNRGTILKKGVRAVQLLFAGIVIALIFFIVFGVPLLFLLWD